MTQIRWDTLVLQVGGWRQTHPIKIVLLRSSKIGNWTKFLEEAKVHRGGGAVVPEEEQEQEEEEIKIDNCFKNFMLFIPCILL
jgi:hypothetical protein